jgi:hypothetical protein
MMMNHETISVRVLPDKENHHLWNNNGTWFVCYTVHDHRTYTKRRVRSSLKTKSLEIARHRRDIALSGSSG